MRIFFYGRLLNSTNTIDKVRQMIVYHSDKKKFTFCSFSNPNRPLSREEIDNLKAKSTPVKKNSVGDISSLKLDWDAIKYGNALSSRIYSEFMPFAGMGIQADVLSSHCAPEIISFRKMMKFRNPKLKHVLSLYGMPFSEPYFSAGKVLSRTADHVIAVSRTTAAEAKEKYGVEASVIHDGVDSDFFCPAEHHNERIRVLYVGTFQKRKNPDLVLKVAKQMPGCDFVLHGRGQLLNELLHLSKDLKNVKISTDFINPLELRDLFATSDIFLFPSTHEGFAGVVLQAGASGLPIVGLNRTSMPEFVENGVEGFLTEDPSGLYEKIKYLAQDEAARRIMGLNARKKAKQFTWESVAENHERVFESLG